MSYQHFIEKIDELSNFLRENYLEKIDEWSGFYRKKIHELSRFY